MAQQSGGRGELMISEDAGVPRLVLVLQGMRKGRTLSLPARPLSQVLRPVFPAPPNVTGRDRSSALLTNYL